MENIPNIELDRKTIMDIYDNHFWVYGGEANLMKVPYQGKNLILKLFYDPNDNQFLYPSLTLHNKKQKIEKLYRFHLPNKITPLQTISYQKEFIGYIMNKPEPYEEFGYNTFTKYEQLKFLKKLRKQLIRFHELGIIYGDLKSDNVLSHTINCKGCLCDLDNMQVDRLPIDIMSNYVDEFLYQYGEIDEKLDWYVFNLLTLEIIHHLDQTTYIPYDETRSFMDHYSGKSRVLREMQQITPNYEGNLLIDDPTFYEEIGIPYCKK